MSPVVTRFRTQTTVHRQFRIRNSLASLLTLFAACAIALGAAQVSGANFNDPDYSPGDAQTFDDMDDADAEEKARDVGKYVDDLRSDIDTAERDGDITSERAGEIRRTVDEKVHETERNYAFRRRSNRGNGNAGGGNANGGSNGNGKSGDVPSAKGKDAATPGNSPSSKDESKKRRQGANSPQRTDGGGKSPTNQAPGTPGVSPAPGGPGAQGGVAVGSGVAGAFALRRVVGDAGEGGAGSGGDSIESRLQALLDGTAGNNVGVDVSNNEDLRKILTQATTGIPLGFQALLMGLLFVVALLLVLMLRERRRAQHVERVSQLDYLTGLANREGFDRMLGIEWRRAMRYGHTLGLVFIDLDDFKRFNDSNGHLAGDRLLREVAAVINSEARASDYTARLGGDEFVILCPETDGKGLEALLRRLEAASVGLAVSLSIGFTHQIPTDTSAEDLVGRADAAMYQAKAERGSFAVPGGPRSPRTS